MPHRLVYSTSNASYLSYLSSPYNYFFKQFHPLAPAGGLIFKTVYTAWGVLELVHTVSYALTRSCLLGNERWRSCQSYHTFRYII